MLRTVECGTHGRLTEAYVCRHIVETLTDGVLRGFWTPDESEEGPPEAWCSACEDKLQRSGGNWTPEIESFVDIRLVCSGCYEQAQAMNFRA